MTAVGVWATLAIRRSLRRRLGERVGDAVASAADAARFAQWLAERPDLAVPRVEVECDCCWGDRGLEVMSPSAAMRRLLHHGAWSLGATVVWDFCVPSVTPPAGS